MARSLKKSSVGVSWPVTFLLVLLGSALSFGSAWFIKGRREQAVPPTSSNSVIPSASSQVLSSLDFGHEFVLNAYTSEGVLIPLSAKLTVAEKLSELSVGGEPFPKEGGEAFLSLNFEVTNESATPVPPKLPSYIRLVDDQDRLIAPTFFNSEVVAPGESTVFDSIAFLVREDQQIFSLRIGEIGSGEYEMLELAFE